MSDRDKRQVAWGIIILGFLCSNSLYKKSVPDIQKILVVFLCATTSIMPAIMYAFVAKNKSDWFCDEIARKNVRSAVSGSAFFISYQLDILAMPGIYPDSLQAIIYILMIIFFSITYTLTRNAGMFEYFFDKISNFGKESSAEVEKLMLLDIAFPRVEKRRHPAGMLSLFLLILITITYLNNKITELVIWILAFCLVVSIFFKLDYEMRRNFYDHFIMLKNAEQEDQYLLLKESFTKKIKSNRRFIRVILLFYFIICAFDFYTLIKQWYRMY